MKETVLTNSERAFVERAIAEKLRIDKRQLNEFRDLGIIFGQEFGSVFCNLGKTKVFCQVSCEVSQPKATRPNEGTLFINVEIGPIAAPHFEVGFPLSEACIQINRTLERTLRDSHCVDLESLCIIAEEKVWNIRVDISVLNYEGNVMDCACIAAVSALAHFRRPDVTTSGDGEFIIHTAAEKDFIPIVLHHYPICVSYALFGEGRTPVADPTALEERVSDASLVLAINSYKEICCMQLTGVSLTSPYVITKCSEAAAERARRIVEFIKSTLEEDSNQRAQGNIPKGFVESIQMNNFQSNLMNEESIERMEDDENEFKVESESENDVKNDKIMKIDEKTVSSGNWDNEGASSSSDDEDMPPSAPQAREAEKQIEIASGESSEEDVKIVLK